MGILFTKLWNKLLGDKEVKIVIVGLDNAGKTTTLYKLHLGDVVVTQPTIGSNVEEVVYKNIRFQMWDLGGQESLRSSWSVYYTNTQGVVLVVDSTDRARIHFVREELAKILTQQDLTKAAILVFANKQDLKGAMSGAEVSKALNLHLVKDHEWHIQPCCALSGTGLMPGMDWLVDKIGNK
ncbi:ADP-ribosylation factor [Acrasis kona]|uniref:ADP-ribosylation factor n=1 Tax=Acrasis kona TaxID=1008807 RepID=A0AAW2ZNV6_9EUKA